jgi:glycerol-3-phosphate dehydrogenase
MKNNQFDFAVIGAGVSGAWIAYELSKYTAKTCLIEKENDVAMGATKANSAIIHAGYDPVPGTLMAKLNIRGNELVRKLCKKMDIPFRQIGSLVIALTYEDEAKIRELYERGLQNGVEGLKILNKAETLSLEPNLSPEVRGALFAETAGVCSSFEMSCAPAEVAENNGVELIRNFKVDNIRSNGEYTVLVSSSGQTVSARTVINAAGVHADEIAKLFGDDSFTITARKGEYSILDNNCGNLVHHVIFQPPVKYGKGILVSQTVDGNIIVGPTAENIDDKENKATTFEGQLTAFEGARRSVPSVSERDVITSFTGIRPIGGKGDFIIGFSDFNNRLFNVAGIESPGLTAGPAIGEYVVEKIAESGFEFVAKENFDNNRKVIRFKDLSDDEKNKIIAQNPLYGRVICRCETVTEGEIADSVTRGAGARDVDGVKRRVRAGMGRCQGGFCGPRVMEIIARELDIPMSEVTKFGGASRMTEKEMI